MKLAIVDRDGTLNLPGEDFIASPDEWLPVPGALEAVARLTQAGWHVVVATNQPGLGRGLFDVLTLNAIHARMHKQLAALGGRIEAVFYCPHAPDEACTCRKPAAGLMEQIRERYGAERMELHVVGNCAEHLLAGAALPGAVLHLVRSASADVAPPLPLPAGVRVHADLASCVEALLAQPPQGPQAAPAPAAG